MRSLAIFLAISLGFASAADLAFPVILPPYGSGESKDTSWGSCLFYLEALNVFIFQKDGTTAVATIGSDTESGNKYVFDKSYVKCPNATSENKEWQPVEYQITVDTKLGKPVDAFDKDKNKVFSVEGSVSVLLSFKTDRTFTWSLKNVTLTKPLSIKKGSGSFISKDITIAEKTTAIPGSLRLVEFGAYNGYNYACSRTKPATFKVDDVDVRVGIGFGNVQFQREGIATEGDKVHFSRQVHDCVGTFSSASWMGIIVTLILVTVLLFGFLMLNSVQTIDRFDDPKQKQLVINSKE